MAVKIAPGFSLTNRWLLYISYALAPAQFLSGLNSNCPSNIGFLAYNWYTQIQWYRLMSSKEDIHAISLLMPHFNLLYAISYLGGVSSANPLVLMICCFATAGAIVLNTMNTWRTFAGNGSPSDIYQFFFFGWRTPTTTGWSVFFILWQVFNTLLVLASLTMIYHYLVAAPIASEESGLGRLWGWRRLAARPIVSLFVFIQFGWPLILWTELIISRNRIQGESDSLSMIMFIVQVAAMLIGTFSYVARSPWRKNVLAWLRLHRSRSSDGV